MRWTWNTMRWNEPTWYELRGTSSLRWMKALMDPGFLVVSAGQAQSSAPEQTLWSQLGCLQASWNNSCPFKALRCFLLSRTLPWSALPDHLLHKCPFVANVLIIPRPHYCKWNAKEWHPYEGEVFASLKQKIPGRLQIIKADDRLPVPHPMKGAVMISSSPQKCWMSLCWPYVQLLRKDICIYHHPSASVPQGHLLSSRLEGVESIIRRHFWRAPSLLCSGTQVELDTNSHAKFLIGSQVEGGKEVSLRDWNFQSEQGCSGSAGRHRISGWMGR